MQEEGGAQKMAQQAESSIFFVHLRFGPQIQPVGHTTPPHKGGCRMGLGGGPGRLATSVPWLSTTKEHTASTNTFSMYVYDYNLISARGLNTDEGIWSNSVGAAGIRGRIVIWLRTSVK
jgi:hypothetical protein